MYMEKPACLSALEEKLRNENEDKLEELTIKVNRYLTEAMEREMRFMGERWILRTNMVDW